MTLRKSDCLIDDKILTCDGPFPTFQNVIIKNYSAMHGASLKKIEFSFEFRWFLVIDVIKNFVPVKAYSFKHP